MTLPVQQHFNLLDDTMRVCTSRLSAVQSPPTKQQPAMVGVTAVVFDAVSGRTAGIVAFAALWLVTPLLMRANQHEPPVP